MTLGCLRKMRSGSAALQRQVLAVAMVSLATGIQPLLRWLPSAWNLADGPSRGAPVGPAPETVQKHASEAEQSLADGAGPAAGAFSPGLLLQRGHL